MTDAAFAFWFGSVIWFLAGVGLVASLVSGWTLFAPFALVFVVLGAGITALGVAWWIKSPPRT